MTQSRDHGGGLDDACRAFGGAKEDWIDLSTGINPNPYPLPALSPRDWAALPDKNAIEGLERAARRFWSVPADFEVVAAGGASAIIAALPGVIAGSTVAIPGPTYNEHQAAFAAQGWSLAGASSDVKVVVHPNNPDGRLWKAEELDAPRNVVDESFCDVCPDETVLGSDRATVILKSFGKFWGLAGLRLGFAICLPDTALKLREQLGPWAVSGPACRIGTVALQDDSWANATRTALKNSATRLDELAQNAGLQGLGGTSLFRLLEAPNAPRAFEQLARHKILSRIFPYSNTWLRLGLPGSEGEWERLEIALNEVS